MDCIQKYRLDSMTTRQNIQLPMGAQVTHVGLDNSGCLMLWALVNTELENEELEIFIFETGEELPSDLMDSNGLIYLGLVILENSTELSVFLQDAKDMAYYDEDDGMTDEFAKTF